MASINPQATSVLPRAQSLPSSQPMPAEGRQALPMTALASPYDGTTPTGGMPIGGYPGAGAPIMGPGLAGPVPQLTGLSGGSRPQLNATNQTAFAPNGDVNQVVTNENQYTNRYYNIVVPHSGGLFGGIGGAGGLFGGWNTPGNSFIDPQTGVLYVQRETGITGWFKRLFRGY